MHTTFFVLSVAVIAATASQIQSVAPGFANLYNSGCIVTSAATNGAPLTINNCNVEHWRRDWNVWTTTAPQIMALEDFNKCWDVKDGVNADGTKVQLWECDVNNSNQQWVASAPEGNYSGSFTWAGTNKCLDLTDGKTADGTQLQIWTCDPNNANQRFLVNEHSWQ